jgi:hypothetical protein
MQSRDCQIKARRLSIWVFETSTSSFVNLKPKHDPSIDIMQILCRCDEFLIDTPAILRVVQGGFEDVRPFIPQNLDS